MEVESGPVSSRRNKIVENARLGGAVHWGKCCFGVVHYEVARRLCQWTWCVSKVRFGFVFPVIAKIVRKLKYHTSNPKQVFQYSGVGHEIFTVLFARVFEQARYYNHGSNFQFAHDVDHNSASGLL